ncbi:unnamed protein product [Nippostrongylus brasiliensis]|uniref:Uncharacterized protein n=1 Tax=Nippostrongylus brasiliensis TaxID=27835 RepID=A0A0N4YA94_NIPBR|nr:unnamed protein product [Nippostrongylus brasiliensis]
MPEGIISSGARGRGEMRLSHPGAPWNVARSPDFPCTPRALSEGCDLRLTGFPRTLEYGLRVAFRPRSKAVGKVNVGYLLGSNAHKITVSFKGRRRACAAMLRWLSVALANGYEIGQGVQASPTVGTWSEWSEWQSCVTTYETRSQTRYRTCSTAVCPGGSYTEARPCPTYEPPPPPPPLPPISSPVGWSEWGPWSECSGRLGRNAVRRAKVAAYRFEPDSAPASKEWCNGPVIEQTSCVKSTPCPQFYEPAPTPPPSPPPTICITCAFLPPPCTSCNIYGWYNGGYYGRKR